MLAMMTIGNNSARTLSPAVVQADAARTARDMKTEVPQVEEAEQIHRRR
jgi:hypothetical protein